MLNPSFFNPGWVGSEDVASTTFQYRSQWTGYATSFDGAGGAPNTQFFSMILPVKGLPISGIGLNVSNDNLGPQNNIQAQLSGSVAVNMRSGSLRFGIMTGIFSQTLSQLRFNDPSDPRNIGKTGSQIRPDFSTGLFYTSNNHFVVGLSAINLFEPNFDFGQIGFQNKFARSYYLYVGKSYSLSDAVTILPTTVIRSNLSGFTFDLSVLAVYQQKVWGGLTYRNEESLILLLGYSFLADNKLKFGYSFDFVINDRQAKQTTSNEILLKYDLPNLIFGGKKSIKTPRFAF